MVRWMLFVAPIMLVLITPGVLGAPGRCVCTLEYAPVCGVNGKTYGNICALQCAQVGLRSPGVCKDYCICNTEFYQVCWTDGKNYGNLCLLKCKGVRLRHRGPCQN